MPKSFRYNNIETWDVVWVAFTQIFHDLCPKVQNDQWKIIEHIPKINNLKFEHIKKMNKKNKASPKLKLIFIIDQHW
jgi:hypothetical protein